MKQHKHHSSDHSANEAQDVNLSASVELDEEALNQVAGGVTRSGNTGWKEIYTLRDGSKMTISPDGKYFTYRGATLPNGTAYLV